MNRRLLTRELPLAAVGYALLAALVTWPVAAHLGSTVLGPMDGDAAAGIWWLDAVQAHGYRVTGSTRFDQVAVPFGVSTGNALNIQTLVPYFPAFLATKIVGAVAAYNLTVLIGFILSGCAMYALARRIGAAPMVASWSGLVYVLFPWHVERAVAGHASLVHIWVFPLLALALLEVHERCTRVRLALVGGAILLCWLTSAFYGVMALALVPVAAVAVAVATVPRRRPLVIAAALSAIAVGVSGGIFVASLAGGKDGGYGASRHAEDLYQYGLRPLELVVPAPASVAMQRLVPGYLEDRRHGSNIQEVSNYLGWTTILLATAWLAAAIRRRRTLGALRRGLTIGAGAAAFTSLAFALPNPVTLLGLTWSWTPSRLLWAIVPAFRVPSRWTVVLLFCVLVLATLGLQAIVGRLARTHPRRRSLGWAVVFAVAVVSFGELRISHPGVHYSAVNVPSEYALLTPTAPGAVAEYPLVATENSTNSVYLLWQRKHGRPLINGAQPGSEAEDVRRSLVDPSMTGTAARLAALGATAVITRPNTLSRALEEEVPDVAPRLGNGYELVGAAGTASVWRVTALPAPAITHLASPAFLLPTWKEGRVVQNLIGPLGTIVLSAEAAFHGTLRLTAIAPRARTVQIDGRSLSVTTRPTRLVIPIDVPAGRSEVRIRVPGVPRNETGLSVTALEVVR